MRPTHQMHEQLMIVSCPMQHLISFWKIETARAGWLLSRASSSVQPHTVVTLLLTLISGSPSIGTVRVGRSAKIENVLFAPRASFSVQFRTIVTLCWQCSAGGRPEVIPSN